MKRTAYIGIALFGLLMAAADTVSADASAGEDTMVLIPAGMYEMGNRKSLLELDPVDLLNTDRHTLGPENPAHRVHVDAYYIDKYEVTNAEYMKFVDATGARKPVSMNDPDFSGERQPAAGMSWKEADSYCKWAGKRLPTEAEWEKAARGKRPIEYPWGDETPDATRVNFNETLNKTAPVGSYETGKSDYGVYDLSGNVSEWVHDWHLAEFYLFSPKENPTGPEKGKYKVIRGGNWRNNAEDISLTYRNATVPNLRSKTLGFRCVKDAK